MIEGPPAAWQAVAQAVIQRRGELGMTQDELAIASGVSASTVRYIEGATRAGYRWLTLAKLASALEWPAARFTELLAGAGPEDFSEPTLADDLTAQRLNDIEDRLDDLAAKVGEIYDRLIGPKAPSRKAPPRRAR